MKHTVALKQNHEFRRLYSKGSSAVSPYFVLYCRPNRRSYSRLGITTGLMTAFQQTCRATQSSATGHAAESGSSTGWRSRLCFPAMTL